MRINTYGNFTNRNNIRHGISRDNSTSPIANHASKRNESSSINLNTSRREAAIYNARGKSGKHFNYGNAVSDLNQILQRRLGYGDNLTLRKEKQSPPEVEVKKVVNLKEDDYRRVYNETVNGSLASRVKERGVYENKKYIVIDSVRYESEIPKSERLKNQKFIWNKK